MAHRIRNGRCALDAGDGALPRFDLCLRARAFPDWHGCGHGAVAAQLLYASGRRSPIEARAPAERARRCGHEAFGAAGRLLHHGQRRAAAGQNCCGEGASSCCAKPAWPQSPVRRFSALAAARTCCASASPSRMRSWTRRASGCGSSEAARRVMIQRSASRCRWNRVTLRAARRPTISNSAPASLRNSTHSSMRSRACFRATSAAVDCVMAKKLCTSSRASAEQKLPVQ